MNNERDRDTSSPDAHGESDEERRQRESGRPGGGQGRRDTVGDSGVYPMSAGGHTPQHNAEVHAMKSWGQGTRGAEGYDDAGGSELVMRDGELLGGLDVGPNGAPVINPPDDAQGNNQTSGGKRTQ